MWFFYKINHLVFFLHAIFKIFNTCLTFFFSLSNTRHYTIIHLLSPSPLQNPSENPNHPRTISRLLQAYTHHMFIINLRQTILSTLPFLKKRKKMLLQETCLAERRVRKNLPFLYCMSYWTIGNAQSSGASNKTGRTCI